MLCLPATGLALQITGRAKVVVGSLGWHVYERDGKYQLYAKDIILDGLDSFYEDTNS